MESAQIKATSYPNNWDGTLGYRLSSAFFDKWVRGRSVDVGAALLASTDPSTVADYGAAFENARSMRIIPMATRNILTIAAILCTPFVPLYFTEFSIVELLQHMADSLV